MPEVMPERHEHAGLDWILAPVKRDHFLGAHWEKGELLVGRADQAYFARLPGLDSVDEIITATTSGPARSGNDGQVVRTERDGTRSQRAIPLLDNGVPDIQDVYRAYGDGYSVVVNQVHNRSGAVASLCRALERDLHHPAGANLYLTPAGAQGFPPHVDTHDVFVLQLHGTKEWHVADAPVSLPLSSYRHPGDAPLGAHRTYKLAPGDALYLPRGLPHEAATGPSSSLHLTVGIHVYRWADLLAEAVQLLAERQPALRGALPPRFLDRPADPADASRLAADLEAGLDANLIEQARSRLAAKLLGTAKAAAEGQFRSIDAVPGLRPDTAVRRATGFLCRVRKSDDEAMIEFAANYVSGPAHITPALQFIAENERFVIDALPGELSASDKVELVSRLVSEGLLTCTQ
jgi:bifunctional lysine-specific demethylase and histidyl-hydroxylase NO66